MRYSRHAIFAFRPPRRFFIIADDAAFDAELSSRRWLIAIRYATYCFSAFTRSAESASDAAFRYFLMMLCLICRLR